ncbi:histidine phosphatase family protein [Tetragenococcus muriaticus]|uniref:histidine phosphatase family protein n=1 Tax=Tetragenococcus muriaticus TaxID=64642 RepID=UPI00042A55E7|nr:histidine phosphatase family protein [Tetragenococcus muriaticus]GMA47577.1 phosphoglycerate mutase [Tetragenococcus muriaticus]
MKKIFYQFFAAILVVLFLAGCSSSQDASNESEETAEENGEVVLYIVRHGVTMLNETDRVQGWSDAVLTPEGEELIENTGEGLSDIDFTAAYSSDSGRSIQTANIILDENQQSDDVSLETDSRFREFNFGSYEGDLNMNMWEDIAESQGQTLEEWRSQETPPQEFADSVAALDEDRVDEQTNWPAEDYETISNRLEEGLDEVAERTSENGGGNVLIVSHGLSIGAMVENISDGYELPTGGLENGSVTTIDYENGEYTIDTVGDVRYTENNQ